MKSIVIETGPGDAKIKLSFNKKKPKYCVLAVYSNDFDMIALDVKTADIYNMASELREELTIGT